MGRRKVYSGEHFRYTLCRNGNGTTYVVRYRNEWNKEKKRSEPKERIYVGSLNMDSGKVTFSKKYLEKYPQFQGTTCFYENNNLVSRTEQQARELIKQRTESCLDDIISPLGGWICWQTALEHNILDDLCSVMNQEDAYKFLQLAIYIFLSENSALQMYEQWLPQQWLPKARNMDSRQTSDLLSKMTEQTSKSYFKLRFDRVRKLHQQLAEQGGFDNKVRHLIALDSTCIHSYSESIEEVAFGHAKQRPDLKQINYTLGVDYLTGETVYALECEGSITDKALYPAIVADMIHSNFDLSDTVLVTDRGYSSLSNLQVLIDTGLGYLTVIPISEQTVKEKFKKYKDSFCSSAFYLPKVDLYCRSFEEIWQKNDLKTGATYPTKQFLHLFMNPEIQMLQMRQLEKIIDEVLEKKNKHQKVEHSLCSQAQPFIVQDNKSKQWFKDAGKLDQVKCLKGAWAIRTNCITDPVAAVRISRQRNVVEEAFRNFKVENSADRLRCTRASYQGKLFLLSIAQSLRNIFLTNVRNCVDPLPQLAKYCAEQRKQHQVDLTEEQRRQLTLPGDSLKMAFASLGRYKAVRAKSGASWIVKKPLPKKARDLVSLLGSACPPKIFHP